MLYDLKVIKKKYGENMMKFCRESFPTLLEQEGVLSNILLNYFYPSHDLYNDIVTYHLENSFQQYILSLSSFNLDNDNHLIISDKTPKELLDSVGYTLFECHDENDIQKFRKYYTFEEELCTFHDMRLRFAYVFFAVHKNAEHLNRLDFSSPARQDEYGTSVISIQFLKHPSCMLSIKNRYNHSVDNCDATFSNNLDNIVPGLTYSFKKYYGLFSKIRTSEFEIPGYVIASNGLFYKYNYEIDGIYYCPNNVIVDNISYDIYHFEPERYLVFDYFILDLQNKTISLYDNSLKDSFPDTILDILKVQITHHNNKKNVEILTKSGSIILVLNSLNCLIEVKDLTSREIGDNYLYLTSFLEKVDLSQAYVVGNNFLYYNKTLKQLSMPMVQMIGDRFLLQNNSLKSLDLLSAESIGNGMLQNNTILEHIQLNNVKDLGYYCLMHHKNPDISGYIGSIYDRVLNQKLVLRKK